MVAVEQLQELQRQQPLQSKDKSSSGKSATINGKLSSTKLSPSPSFDQSTKDYEQVVRDLYDTMEREKDLQEQLKFAEEETKTMRKKLSTMEQENEILMMQIRKMASKNNSTKVDDDDESEELNPEEMKLHLELYEQEMIVLRRKTDELEQENENFQQEIKYLQEKLVSQPLAKVEIPEIPAGSPPNVIYDHKIRLLEGEARELRKKLVDKEKENESLRTEVELHRRRASKVISRSRSLDGEGQSLDMKKQLQLFEQEATILRQKLIMLENDNEKYVNENKRLQLRISKKPPPGPADQLQLENMELKDKIRELERKCDSLKTDLINSKLNETTETETDFIANLKKQLRTKDNDLANLTTKMAQVDLECTRINREYKKLKDSLVTRRHINRVIRETATRMELKEIIKEMETEISELMTTSRGKEAIIENLNEEVSELKREYQEMENRTKSIGNLPGNSNNNNNNNVEELRKRLEDEQYRVKCLEARLEKFGNDKNVDMNMMDSLEMLQMEKKEMAMKLDDMTIELQNARSKADDLAGKLNVFTRNKDDLATVNSKLRETLEKAEDEIDELQRQLNGTKELYKQLDEAKRELERVSNHNGRLQKDVDEYRSKLTAINSRSGDVSERTAFLQKECTDLKRKLEDSNRLNESIQRQIDSLKSEMKEKEIKFKEELNEKLENNSKKVRREVHLELQNLREESTNQRNRCSELVSKLDQAERDLKESNEKIKTNIVQMRKEREELTDRLHSWENQAKTEQRKREKLERDLENSTRGKENELLQAQEKVVQMERDARRLQAKLEDIEYECQGKVNLAERESIKLKQDYEDLTNKYDLLEKDFVQLKSRSVSEKDTLVETVSTLKKSYEDTLAEIKGLKESSIRQQKEWFKEKLHYQERVASLEAKANKAKLVEEERDRMKVLIGDKENLLNSYRKEERVYNEERERNRIKMDEMVSKLSELEKAERNTRFLSITGRAQVDKELQDYRIRLEHSETSHKGELAALHAEYEGRMRLLGDEVEHMQQQIAMMAQERDRYRESLERTTKEMSNRHSLRGTLRDEIEDLNSQLRTLRSDLEGALLENRNLKIQHGTERSSWQIQLAEYKTQINQMEERILLETRGSTRNYARTKMEIAWEKERQENLRLLQETQRFIQELRDKLVGIESLREKEREESRKQLLELKNNMDKEHVDTEQKVSELHFDLLALKEAHARLKSQNERLRRERVTIDQLKTDFVNEQLEQLKKLTDGATGKKGKEVTAEVVQLQQKLKTRLDEMIQEASVRGSEMSLASRLNGSMTSISSTTLPPPCSIKRAPPRKLAKKSLSLDQHLTNSRGVSQERIWDSDHSLNTTPNSSVSNLRFAPRYGYAGYESDSSASSFFMPSSVLRLKPGFTKESSFAGGSESDTSINSSMQSKEKLSSKGRLLKIGRSSKTSEHGGGGGGGTSEDESNKLKQKLTLQGFEMSPLELAKQREKKEKSLRYKISKTLSKTFSRSTSVLPIDGTDGAETSKSRNRNKSPSRTKSPTRNVSQDEKQKTETITINTTRPIAKIGVPSKSVLVPEISSYKPNLPVPGLAQLRQRPATTNLAIPPSRRSPPKVRLRTETNV
ncbi:hypothetical protein RDWZM_000934 [Blomia tropicalis]|uniref:Uncharacterized protein n=1 Tax=Blomia tropicalis TaxID=40697 RepID=A0A9Q0MB47_BLOTA|nr:hypothetical protein RDWZM_000934 [Blomia tropicalis]